MQTEDQHEEVCEYLGGNQSLSREALPQKMDEGEDQRASKRSMGSEEGSMEAATSWKSEKPPSKC